MTADLRKRGYVAVDRHMVDHHVFRGRDDWIVAFTRMLGYAAYQPCAQRGAWGPVHVERGEFATTIRTLADVWGWPKSNVDCFLRRLVRFEIIELSKTRTATRTTTGTSLPHPVTIVRLCNYDKYHRSAISARRDHGRNPGQDPGQGIQEDLPLQGLPASQPTNQGTSVVKTRDVDNCVEEGQARGVRRKPRDGAISADGKWIWFDHGTHNWDLYAADYSETRGAQRLPEPRIGGRGNWFSKNGESLRPAPRGRRRA